MTTLRSPGTTVPWYHLVWFAGHIPRQSTVLWFAILNKLSTHDRISLFTPGPLACTLCHQGMESHDHLFFSFPYSTFVWQGIQHRMRLTLSATTWDTFIVWAGTKWKRNIPGHVIPRLSLGAVVYGLWQERNARTFKNVLRTKHQLLQDVTSQILLQLRAKYRKDPQLHVYEERWL